MLWAWSERKAPVRVLEEAWSLPVLAVPQNCVPFPSFLSFPCVKESTAHPCFITLALLVSVPPSSLHTGGGACGGLLPPSLTGTRQALHMCACSVSPVWTDPHKALKKTLTSQGSVPRGPVRTLKLCKAAGGFTRAQSPGPTPTCRNALSELGAWALSG